MKFRLWGLLQHSVCRITNCQLVATIRIFSMKSGSDSNLHFILFWDTCQKSWCTIGELSGKRLHKICFSQWKKGMERVGLPQRWADCEIFQSESSPDLIKLNPIQSWSAKFLKIISPIQSWSAHVKSRICILNQYWSYFTFSQIWLVEGKIVPVVLLARDAK